MLLAHPSGGAFLADVARRARKHYLGLVTIWQKVGDLTGSEHGETILTNSEMKLLLKQSEEIIDAADARFRFTPSERRFLLGALKGEGSAVRARWALADQDRGEPGRTSSGDDQSARAARTAGDEARTELIVDCGSGQL